MEEALRIHDHLPIFYANREGEAYIRFLWDAFETNYNAGKYEFARFVKQRNRIAHPSGTVFFNSKENIDEQIEQVMVEIDSIQQHMTPVLHDCLRAFLEENADPEEWEYSLPRDQIDATLIHAQYFSRKDVDASLAFDISAFDGHASVAPIRELFDAFRETFQPGTEE